MAYLFRKKSKRVGANGKVEVVESEKWYVRFYDESGRRRKRVAYVDRRASQQLAARIEREVAQKREGIFVEPEGKGRTPLAMLPLYMRHLQSKGVSAGHAKTTEQRIRSVLTSTNGKLESGPVAEFLLNLRGGKKPRSIASANNYLSSVKSFATWLVNFKGWPKNPLVKLKRNRSEAGQRVRRALTHGDFMALINATQRSPRVICRLNGEQRAMLYLTAAFTGLRASELASLTPESFRAGTVTVDASYSKHRRRDVLPLMAKFNETITAWIKSIPAGQRLWPHSWASSHRASRMIGDDLANAGVPVRTAAGVFDFHCLRVQFITSLARAGVSLVHAQRLARHSTPDLTANYYTRLDDADLRRAANQLPFDEPGTIKFPGASQGA